MDAAAGSCNACGATGTALMKLSLGKDFFDRAYDRLSPSTDQSPKWYCDQCSMQKNLQRDFRDIRAEFDKLAAGQSSELSKVETFQRAAIRLREIVAILAASTGQSPFLAADNTGFTLAAVQTSYFHLHQPAPERRPARLLRRPGIRKAPRPFQERNETPESEGVGAREQSRVPRPLRLGSQRRDLS
jgi:glutathione S-transferase